MDEQNEKLLQQFFSEAAQQTIADNGFTERVMSQLPPANVKRFTRIWTVSCILVAAILFTLFHGWELLLVQMEVFLRTMIVEPPQINPVMVVLTLFSLMMIGVYEVLSYERVIR